jgi:hypothetical protein
MNIAAFGEKIRDNQRKIHCVHAGIFDPENFVRGKYHRNCSTRSLVCEIIVLMALLQVTLQES